MDTKRLLPEPWPPPAAVEPDFSESTLGAIGKMLPVGIHRGGVLHKRFDFCMVNSRVERELEEQRRRRNIGVGDFMTGVLCRVLTRLGHHDGFQELDDDERRLVIHHLTQPDVMYLWLALRVHVLGKDCKFQFRCPACDHKWTYIVDLEETDVRYAERPDQLSTLLELKDGFDSPAGRIEAVHVSPPPFSSYVEASAPKGKKGVSPNFGDIKAAMIAGSITASDGRPIPSRMSAIEEMSKYDVELVMQVIDDELPGPDMILQIDCPECGEDFRNPLQWDWDFFFGKASLCAPARRSSKRSSS